MGGTFRLKWVGHLQLRWVRQLWQSELLLFGRYAKKKYWFSGEYPFGPFDGDCDS